MKKFTSRPFSGTSYCVMWWTLMNTLMKKFTSRPYSGTSYCVIWWTIMNYINEKIYFLSLFWYILLFYIMNPNEYTGLLSHLYSPFDLTKNYSNFARQIESSSNPLVSDNLEGIKSSILPPFFRHFRRQEIIKKRYN